MTEPSRLEKLAAGLAILACATVQRTTARDAPWQLCTSSGDPIIIPGRADVTLHKGTAAEQTAPMPASWRTKKEALAALEYERAVIAVAAAEAAGRRDLARTLRQDFGVSSLSPWVTDEETS